MVICEIASYPVFDKDLSKAILFALKRKGVKFGKRLEKKIKKWEKESEVSRKP